jgi:hypothetical protein
MIDLDLRSGRMEKEQQKRREEAKKKKAREAELQRLQAQREKEQALLAVQRREEMEKLEMERQLAKEEENRLTGGIQFKKQLIPYAVDGEDDKVLLPEDCLTDLSQQDAFGRGAAMFELRAEVVRYSTTDSQSGTITSGTHCGVREFSAPAGHIGLPKKVVECLAQELSQIKSIEIKFVVLPKCTYAKLRPRHNNFVEVGPVKLCLEENLRFHTTLSVGDQLTVWYRGALLLAAGFSLCFVSSLFFFIVYLLCSVRVCAYWLLCC